MFPLQIFTFLAIFSFAVSNEETSTKNGINVTESSDKNFWKCMEDGLGNSLTAKYFPNADKFEEVDGEEFFWRSYCQLYKLRIRNWCNQLNDKKKSEEQFSLNKSIRWTKKREPANIEHTFSVFRIYITRFYHSEWSQDTVVDAYIVMEWVDKRLSWKEDETIKRSSCKRVTSLKKKIELKGPSALSLKKSELWTPDVKYQSQESYFVDDDQKYDNDKVYIDQSGHAIWHDYVEVQNNCPMDFKNFPYDRHNCCIAFNFRFKVNPQKDNQNIVRIKNRRLNWGTWDIVMSKTTAYWKTNGYNWSTLKVCFTIQRRSTLIYYQLVLPLAATAFLTILGPLIGSWKIQLFLRIFSILLLVINLQETTGWHLAGLGKNAPRIVVLYDFYIWVTAVSLVISLGLWSTSKVKNRAKLPPGPLGMLGYWLNPWMPCTAVKGSQGQDAKSMAEEGQVDVKVDVDYAWQEVLIGLNNVVNIVVTIVYILGSIIIGA